MNLSKIKNFNFTLIVITGPLLSFSIMLYDHAVLGGRDIELENIGVAIFLTALFSIPYMMLFTSWKNKKKYDQGVIFISLLVNIVLAIYFYNVTFFTRPHDTNLLVLFVLFIFQLILTGASLIIARLVKTPNQSLNSTPKSGAN
jgi:FlaA1/EpsC-like NDP-sugar epimerase